MNISPNLMFFLPGSNAYTLKMLLPVGFQQTGGNLTEYVTGELAYPGKQEATYTVRGFFTGTDEKACFRLLRSDGQATSQSLFVEKATLCLPVYSINRQGAARTATTNSSVNWCVEAESGSGNRGVLSSGQASAGQYTGSFGNSGEYMNYTITGVPSAGGYTLHLLYSSGDSPQIGVVVNGSLQTASVSSNGNWAGPFTEKTVAVNLQAGNNSLRIQGAGNGSFNLDRLCVNGGGGGSTCTPPSLSLGTPTCSGNTTYSVGFSAQSGANVSTSAGSVQGNQVVNIPAGSFATITASLNGCSSQQTANSPTCNSGGNPSGCGTGSGLTGFYTNTTDLSTNLVAIRTDAKIDFAWGNNSPMASVVNADGFSIRWYGQVEAPVSGNYVFKTNNDDGTRLWVNDQILIDDWNGHPPTWKQGSIYLTAGQKYPIEMVFVDYGGGAQAQLYWEYPGQSTQIVPSCRLYTSFAPTVYNNDLSTSISTTNPTQPYGYCSISINYLTFFQECYSGKVVDYAVYTPIEPDEPIDPIFHPGPNYPILPAGTGGGNGLPPGPWHNPGLPPIPILIQTGLPLTAITLNNFYANMWQRGIFFTADEKAVLNRYPQLINSIRAYVNQYNSKPDFIFLMDKYLEDTYAFVTSPAERAILANRSWQDQITFRGNAINASLEAVTRFNAVNCQDNACNAYRHAFFNALNAQSFTVAVARQLGQAREGNRMIDPNTLLPTNFVCNPNDPAITAAYMDLFNNEWGYRAFNQFQSQGGNLSAIVWTMANNGSLRNAPGCP